MSLREEIVWLAEERAGRRCEYCRMHQALQGATFHVEPVMPSARGGASDLGNLAWCCPGCNLHKSDRIDAVDPDTGTTVRLFNPRIDRWSDHFRWEAYHIVGQTAEGRATAHVLDMNHPRKLLIRQAEELFDLFPP